MGISYTSCPVTLLVDIRKSGLTRGGLEGVDGRARALAFGISFFLISTRGDGGSLKSMFAY